MNNFILFLNNPKRKQLGNFHMQLALQHYNKIILDEKGAVLLFLNASTSAIIELIQECEVGIYIIAPFQTLLTNSKLIEADTFKADDNNDNLFAYLAALNNSKNLTVTDEAFIQAYGNLLHYNTDEILDKINLKGGIENLNAAEKYYLTQQQKQQNG